MMTKAKRNGISNSGENSQALDELQSFFRFEELSEDAAQRLIRVMDTFPGEIVGEAVMNWMDTHIPTRFNFPTVAQMESALIEARQKLEKQKRDFHKTEEAIPSPPNEGFVSAISQLVQKRLDKREDYPTGQYAHDLEELDGEYPYLGLKMAVAVNKMYVDGKLNYDEQGYILSVWRQRGIEKARDLVRQQWQHPGYIGRLLSIKQERWQKISWGKPFAS